ncbi:MAG: hypothetical protein ACRCUJ_03415, partial [Phocaeicola sp.]
REVKPCHADGTADCGRVGSRRFLEKSSGSNKNWGIFFCVIASWTVVYVSSILANGFIPLTGRIIS